jgi:predicted DNA-binding protein (MmcQ/YjbR family)
MTTKTDAQALAWMRQTCLAYPDASEGVHYGEIVFKSAGKMFASCGDKRGPTMIVLGLAPEHAKQVLAANPSWKRYPYEKSGIMIKATDVSDWDELRAFIAESHRLYASPSPSSKKPSSKRKAPKRKAPKPKRAKKRSARSASL